VLKSIPGFAKIIMLIQTAVILFLLFWLVEEYANNAYFQAYVNSFAQGTLFAAIVAISIIGFILIALLLYWHLRKTRKELDRLLSIGKTGTSGASRDQVLDDQTEQHLIEMIRKSTPIMNSGTGDQMPVLRRTRPEEERSSQQ
jgi:hypothetical protein